MHLSRISTCWRRVIISRPLSWVLSRCGEVGVPLGWGFRLQYWYVFLVCFGGGNLPAPSQSWDCFAIVPLVDNGRVLYELWFLIVFMPWVGIVGDPARDWVMLDSPSIGLVDVICSNTTLIPSHGGPFGVRGFSLEWWDSMRNSWNAPSLCLNRPETTLRIAHFCMRFPWALAWSLYVFRAKWCITWRGDARSICVYNRYLFLMLRKNTKQALLYYPCHVRLSGPDLLTIHLLCSIKVFDRLSKLLKVLVLHSDVVLCDDHGCVYIFNVGIPLELLCLRVNVRGVRAWVTRFGLSQLCQDLLAALQAVACILDGFLMSIEVIRKFLLFQSR